MSAAGGVVATPPVNDLDWDQLGFKLIPTDKMYVAKTKSGEEWKPGELQPYGDITMSPCASVLNYGQGLFEGMKAQRNAAGEILLFRPDANAKRFAEGAARFHMQPVPTDMFVNAVQAVVEANAKWVPPAGKGALYVRPVLWGSGAELIPTPSPEYTFIIYVTPVGPYFSKVLSLRTSTTFHRACPGGQGGVKAVGNYAPCFKPVKQAKSDGFDEVLYLDSVEDRFIEEVGSANFFCLKDGVVRTPQLLGTILPGVTRMSVLQLAQDLGYEVREERVDIETALSADECFCTGTAAVVSPIGKITHGDKCKVFGDGESFGEFTRKLRETLTAIQQGSQPDKYGWVVPVKSQC